MGSRTLVGGRAWIVVAGCALLVALASVPSPADAAYPGSNGKVAFVRANQIWTVNADGTGEIQLTSAAAPSFDPQWSPNGTRILYTRGSIDGPEVRVMNANGTGDTQVSPPVQSGTVSPTWSPDGSRVAIVERLTEGTGCGCPVDRIVLVDPDGSRRENHSEGFGDSDRGFGPVGGLQWSPKGNELIFNNGGAGEMRIYIRGVLPDRRRCLPAGAWTWISSVPHGRPMPSVLPICATTMQSVTRSCTCGTVTAAA